MKKLFIAFGLLSILSCSDDFDKTEKSTQQSRVPSDRLLQITALSNWDNGGTLIEFTQGYPSNSYLAKNNLILFEHFIDEAVNQGKDGLEITGSFDCYFAVGSNLNGQAYYESNDGITLPSNFTLQMSDGENGTHLRVYSNAYAKSRLIGIYRKENVNIYGGNLHGSRLIESADTNEGVLLDINSGRNVNVEDTKFYEANGDGMWIHSWCHYMDINGYVAGYVGNESSQILINNTFFDSNRGNGIGITDGNNITITNSVFKDSSKNLPNSNGRGGSQAIDIEAFRDRLVHGDITTPMIFFDDAHHITIDKCTEYGGRMHAFVVAVGHDVSITNCNTESGIGSVNGHTVLIANNVVKHNPSFTYAAWQKAGIFAGFNLPTDMEYGFTIKDNRVENYEIGIDLLQRDGIVSGNLILDCTRAGIRMWNVKNYDIFNNNIKNSVIPGSGHGIIATNIYSHLSTTCFLDNVNIHDNDISLLNNSNTYYPLYFSNVNQGSVFQSLRVNIYDNDFNAGISPVNFSQTNGIIFKNNYLLNGGVWIAAGSTNVDLLYNTILPNLVSNSNGIYISGSSLINIKNNNITLDVNSSQRCINATLSSNLNIETNILTDPVCNGTLWIDRCTSSTIINNYGYIGTSASSQSFLAITPNNNNFSDNRAHDTGLPRNRFI